MALQADDNNTIHSQHKHQFHPAHTHSGGGGALKVKRRTVCTQQGDFGLAEPPARPKPEGRRDAETHVHIHKTRRLAWVWTLGEITGRGGGRTQTHARARAHTQARTV